MRSRVPASLAVALLLSGCAAASRPSSAPAAPAARAASFITTFWCGPPLELFDDVRAAEIAAAGFNVVGAPCEGEMTPALNRKALDVAARHGLRMWLRDSRYDERAATRPAWEAGAAAAVSEYANHPAFGGYFVTDEPTTGQFGDLAAIVARLRELDPDGLAYINLLPDYAVTSTGEETYREYVDRFVSMVRPSLLSYDYYAFGLERDRATFFDNLALFRERALTSGLPFLFIGLAMPHGPYRDPTEAEVSWQMLHALAYGARGVSYFAYWTPVDVEHAEQWKFRLGLIEHGQRTGNYAEAARINRMVRAFAGALDGFRSVAVIHALPPVGDPAIAQPVAVIADATVTLGLFEDG
jgi:hypothetical protein